MFSKLIPISKDLADKGVMKNTDYLFAKNETMCELVYGELAKASSIFPVAMVRIDNIPKLIAMLSVLPNQNCFVSPDGRFLAAYVPRIINQYPFTLYPMNGERILCIEESALASKTQVNTHMLYEENGNPSALLQSYTQIWEEYRTQQVATDEAMQALDDAGIFCEWDISLEDDEGFKKIEGIYRIDEDKMRSLDGNILSALVKSGALGIAYAQILSRNNINFLKDKVSEHAQYLREKKELLSLQNTQSNNADDNKGNFDWGF